MMKVVVGTMSHESNSFNPSLTQLEDFNPLYGPEIASAPERLENSGLKGIINVLEARDVDIVPLVFARACPGGLVAADAYESMKEVFLNGLKKAGKVDGVCLDLHGSMTVSTLQDAEGDLLASVRAVVGPDVPIVCVLDMHAMVTPQMIASADALVGYRTAPHVDVVETGERAATLLCESLEKGFSMCMAGVPLPILISGEQSESDKEPMASLIAQLRATDCIPGILSSSLLLGFPWVDVSFNMGCTLVVTRDDAELARREAIHLASEFMKRLEQFTFTTEAYPFDRALEIAMNAQNGPVFIADCGDMPGAGGSQDVPYSLERMLAYDARSVLLAAIADSALYATCASAGVGSRVHLCFGSECTVPGVRPLNVKGTVMREAVSRGASVAVIRVRGIDVVITDQRMAMTDPGFLENLGLDPGKYRLVVLKGGYFDPKYQAIASRGILGLTPGYTNQILRDLEYRRVQRPIYPLDHVDEFVRLILLRAER